jgi:hypothetical protein
MEYTAFISRLSVEENMIKASSLKEALAELERLAAQEKNDTPVVHYGLTTDGKLPEILHNFPRQNILSLNTAEAPLAERSAVLQHLFDELKKGWIVLEALAWGTTTEDLAVERGESPEAILETRDYFGEYEAFMTYIVSARRALNLPDVLGEPDESWPD